MAITAGVGAAGVESDVTLRGALGIGESAADGAPDTGGVGEWPLVEGGAEDGEAGVEQVEGAWRSSSAMAWRASAIDLIAIPTSERVTSGSIPRRPKTNGAVARSALQASRRSASGPSLVALQPA